MHARMIALFAAVVLITSLARAEDAKKVHGSFLKGFSLEVEAAPSLRVRGNDVHVGDEFELFVSREYRAGSGVLDFTYGVSYKRIETKMENGAAYIPTLTYRRPGRSWGFTVTGWSSAVAGSAAGAVATPKGTQTMDRAHGVRIFGQSLAPLTDQRKPGNAADMQYHAHNRLSVWVADATAFKTVVGESKNAVRLDVFGGIRATGIKNLRQDALHTEAYIYDLFSPNDFHNTVTLDAQSRANSRLLFGPLVGLRGEARVRNVTLSAYVAAAWLFGDADHTGSWYDGDDIYEVREASNGSFERVRQRHLFAGNFPFASQERADVRSADFTVKGTYALTTHVGVSVGYRLTSFDNVPIAKAWVVPGGWTALAGTAWQDQLRALTFSGVTYGVVYRF